MYKKVNFLGYLLILSASIAGAAEGPHTNTAEDYFKVLQKEHKQTIQKGGDILKTYLHRVNHLSTLAFISDQINEHIQNVVRNSGSILENHIMEFKEGLKDGFEKMNIF